MRVLWVTNDLPPQAGGIQQFVENLLLRVHPERTAVIGPFHEAAHEHDEAVPYRVIRHDRGVWPTPGVLALIRDVGREHRPDVVVLGASWPLGELAGRIRESLGVPVVALTHGLEAGLAGAGLGWLIRRAARQLAAVTTISDWTEERLAPYLQAPIVRRVPPGVDVERFRPDVGGDEVRRRWGVPGDAPVLGCISRLVKRKGQDVLLAAWPQIAETHTDAWLVIVGGGPLEPRLRDRADALDRVVIAGGVPWSELPASYAALDVFAMPCRTRLAGLDVEGLGIVYLEAQATGVPVIGGRSGGAPEAIRDGRTGVVVDGTSVDDVAEVAERLLADAELRRVLGSAGRQWAEERWSWDVIAADFERLLTDVAAS